MAQTPEDSEYTSIQERIEPRFDLAEAIKGTNDLSAFHINHFHLKPLTPFDGSICSHSQSGIPFSFKEYLILVDTTGRIQREHKRGFIPGSFKPILQRLNIEPEQWIKNTQAFEKIYRTTFSRSRQSLNAA